MDTDEPHNGSSSQTHVPLSIYGSVPGVIDPSQPARLLSDPNSKLSFASFHPRTASSHQDPRKLSAREELCSSRRIVIETLPSGESFWRWVPRAKGVENVEDEGQWPRVVEICGHPVHCSLEQWDIYKIDPLYDCTVHPHPRLSTITPRKAATTSAHSSRASLNGESHSQSYSKRQPSPPSSDSDVPREAPTKKARNARVDLDSDDEDEVAEMITDDPPPNNPPFVNPHDRFKERRATMKENQRIRREKIASRRTKRHSEDLTMHDLSLDDMQIPTPPPSFRSTQKSEQPSPTCTSKRSWDDTPEDRKKRARTAMPPSMRKNLAAKREEWQKTRLGRFQERKQERRDARDQMFMESLYHSFTSSAPTESTASSSGEIWILFPLDSDRLSSTVASESYNTAESSTSTEAPQSSQPTEEEEEDPVSLEEKINRMAEINAYERIRREKEAQRQAAEEEERERRRKAAEHAARMERERIEREREQERRRKAQQEERWLRGAWTTQRALERYKSLAESFDAAKYSAETPVDFRDIPWPVLYRPTTFSTEDVDWSAVEAFFKAVKSYMKSQDYTSFVEKSHRRFHPDRWRARRVLLSITNDEMREMMEIAANTVAQAITPLWREVKGG